MHYSWILKNMTFWFYFFQVYPDNTNVDDVLVESIVVPSQDPNAAEVYYR